MPIFPNFGQGLRDDSIVFVDFEQFPEKWVEIELIL
jgi:hypothetical protein